MMLEVLRCAACGTTLFPARYFCPACGGDAWTRLPVQGGTVAAATIVRHRAGAPDGSDVHIADVATDAGPVVVARLPGPLAVGAAVALEIDAEHRITARAA